MNATAFALSGHNHDSRYWGHGGNAGTDPATHFLGTTDNTPFELRVNGDRALRLEPTGGTPHVIGGFAGNVVAPGINGATIAGGGNPTETTDPGKGPNQVFDTFGTIGGGRKNTAGKNTTPDGETFATVGGGRGNDASSADATIGGGENYAASGSNAIVGGGQSNAASGLNATVGGGKGNDASFTGATVAGGELNEASGSDPTVGGGFGNTASTDFATIGGGVQNAVFDLSGTIAGGEGNTAGDDATAGSPGEAWATVGGGLNNTAGAPGSTVGGGKNNIASGNSATVAGGQSNTAGGGDAAVGGGSSNVVSAVQATVAGGEANTASGGRSAIGGGRNNIAGAFLWADSNNFDFVSTAANEFAARATGGVRFVSAVAGSGNPTAGVTLAPGAGSWSSLSDRNAKTAFEALSGGEVLRKLSRIAVREWSYEAQPGVRHAGLTAQAFYHAFGLGADRKRIATVDADGVALAAIKGLNRKLERRLRDQRERIGALERRLAALERRAR